MIGGLTAGIANSISLLRLLFNVRDYAGMLLDIDKIITKQQYYRAEVSMTSNKYSISSKQGLNQTMLNQ